MEFEYTLLAKYLAEELSPEELAQMMQWRTLSPHNQQLFEQLVKARITNRFLEYNSPERVDTALQAIAGEINKRNVRQRFLYWSSCAAVILFLLTATWFYYGPGQEETFLHIAVEQGAESKKVELADGSVVWLNSGTTLQIPAGFSPSSRWVRLQGEAYFDVVSNPVAPFVVETERMDVRVVGTSFNINTGQDGQAVETVLASGKMELLDKKDRKLLIGMLPGEKVTYLPETHELLVSPVDINVSTAWHLRQMIFENTSLREIVNKLSMLFDVNINLESKQLADRRYRCVINKEETLAEILEHLKYMTPLEYSIEGKEVFIKE